MTEKSVEVGVNEFADALGLEVLVQGGGKMTFISAEINRPGLRFAGYYEHFLPRRVQMIGNAEMHYLFSLSEEEMSERILRFLHFPIPCIVCSRGNTPPKVLLESAGRMAVPVFWSDRKTDDVTHRLYDYIQEKLAPRILTHGVLMDVFGVGVLLRGESGMGKSETALELIRTGHRLVADDVVEIIRIGDQLIGKAPELTRHLMEIRGIGIIDIRHFYGVGAVMPDKNIDYVIDLRALQEGDSYQRAAHVDDFTQILDLDVPHTVLPVSPGRNMSILIEVAARNFRLKRMGYDASLQFREKVNLDLQR